MGYAASGGDSASYNNVCCSPTGKVGQGRVRLLSSITGIHLAPLQGRPPFPPHPPLIPLHGSRRKKNADLTFWLCTCSPLTFLRSPVNNGVWWCCRLPWRVCHSLILCSFVPTAYTSFNGRRMKEMSNAGCFCQSWTEAFQTGHFSWSAESLRRM